MAISFTQAKGDVRCARGGTEGLPARQGIKGATKAFDLFLSQDLHLELGPKGVYVQAVLPNGRVVSGSQD